MENELAVLRQTVNSIHPLANEIWNEFSIHWQQHKAKKNQILTSSGSTEKYLYFVTNGIQRIYYSDEQGREATIILTYAPSFAGVIDSLLLQQPSGYAFETLTASAFLRIAHSDLFKLMNHYPDIEKMVRIGITHALAGTLYRLAELQSFTSEEKLKALLKRSPHILHLIPQKYLANYLGMDATNFSKFMNSIKI